MLKIEEYRRQGYSELELWKLVLEKKELQRTWEDQENVSLFDLERIVFDIELLHSSESSKEKRIEAIEELGKLGDDRVFPYLLPLFEKERDLEVLEPLCNSLGQTNPKEAVLEFIKRYQSDSSNCVQNEILFKALGKLMFQEPLARHFLCERLSDSIEENTNIAARVFVAYTERNSWLQEDYIEDVSSALLKSLKTADDWSFCNRVITFIKLKKLDAIEPLIEIARGGLNEHRLGNLVLSISNIRGPKSIEALKKIKELPGISVRSKKRIDYDLKEAKDYGPSLLEVLEDLFQDKSLFREEGEEEFENETLYRMVTCIQILISRKKLDLPQKEKAKLELEEIQKNPKFKLLGTIFLFHSAYVETLDFIFKALKKMHNERTAVAIIERLEKWKCPPSTFNDLLWFLLILSEEIGKTFVYKTLHNPETDAQSSAVTILEEMLWQDSFEPIVNSLDLASVFENPSDFYEILFSEKLLILYKLDQEKTIQLVEKLIKEADPSQKSFLEQQLEFLREY